MLAPDGTGRRRVQRLAAQGLVVASLVGVTGAFATLHKDVTLDVDGELHQVSAYGRTVAAVLDYQGVAVGEQDLVEPALADPARDGGTIVVRTSHDVTVEIDGQVQTIPTTARTVGELLTYLGPRAEGAVTEVSRTQALGREPIRVSTLKTVHVAVDGAVMPITTAEPTVRGVLATAGIVLAEGDGTSAPLDAAAVDGMLVLVSRAAATADTVTEVLPFETEEREDPTLPQGHRVVVQSGRVGEAVTTYSVQTLGGAEVSRTVLTRTVTTEPRNEVIKVGTMDVSVSVDPGSARAVGRPRRAARLGRRPVRVPRQALDQGEQLARRRGQPELERVRDPAGPPRLQDGERRLRLAHQPGDADHVGLGYIEGRYGTPCSAWSHSVAKGWY